MKLKTAIIKVILFFSYLLPFASCQPLSTIKPAGIDSAFTETPDTSSIEYATSPDTISYLAEHSTDTSATPNKGETLPTQQRTSIEDTILTLILFPTNDTISAFGVMIYSDNTNAILIGISILLSILALFERPIKFVKNNIAVIYIVNLLCLLSFIGYSIFTSIEDLKWGVFVTLGLLVLLFWIELKSGRVARVDHS